MSDEAWDYDLTTGHVIADLGFWSTLIEQYRPRRVLEIGCRTGRVSFSVVTKGLATQPGFHLTSLDTSWAMLDRARARLQSNYPAAASALRFVQGEIAPANLTDTFDLVICPLGALSAWINPDQQRDCVRAIRACLVLGGHCAIDVNVPCLGRLIDAMHGAQPFAGERLDRLGPAPGVARFVSEVRTTSYDAASQSETAIRHSEIYFADGRHQSLVRERTWHQYFPNELRHLFFSNGFAPVAEYGTYELAPFSATSPQYLWVMVAA